MQKCGNNNDNGHLTAEGLSPLSKQCAADNAKVLLIIEAPQR